MYVSCVIDYHVLCSKTPPSWLSCLVPNRGENYEPVNVSTDLKYTFVEQMLMLQDTIPHN